LKLLVDLGNTRVKWAWLAGGELLEPGALAHAGLDPDRLAARIAAGRTTRHVCLASVAGAGFTAALDAALGRVTGAPVRQVHTGRAAAGVRNAYTEPRQLGVDRWLAMLGAYARLRSAVCVVDAGTAWTVDLVDANGDHLGGLIVPGPELMRRSLVGATGGIDTAVRLLPGAAAAVGAWGRDTEACMRNGAQRAGVCLVESSIRDFAQRQGQAPTLVLTGGDAPGLLAMLSVPAQHRPWLVLEGLALAGASDAG
jgi:type III pantothenate kinase